MDSLSKTLDAARRRLLIIADETGSVTDEAGATLRTLVDGRADAVGVDDGDAADAASA